MADHWQDTVIMKTERSEVSPWEAVCTQKQTQDGLNLYTYCQNNPILYHDPTGHGTKENSPYSRNEQQYIDVGADPDTARLAAQCYPDAKSKQDLYNKYKKQGYSAQDAKKLATSPRDNVNTDWRTQERLNAQRNAGAGKGNYLQQMRLLFLKLIHSQGIMMELLLSLS